MQFPHVYDYVAVTIYYAVVYIPHWLKKHLIDYECCKLNFIKIITKVQVIRCEIATVQFSDGS